MTGSPMPLQPRWAVGRRCWQALLQRSQELIGQIDQLLDQSGFLLSIDPGWTKKQKPFEPMRWPRSSTCRPVVHWTRWGLFTPKVVKERTYLRDQVTVDGQPADTPERLQAVCHHLDLTFAIEALERAWSDHGGLPIGF